ncbi:uncharacterized protein LOC124479876 [Hypomesus transpacificus]|uniref:uncharacterized protein LOC124479876 n=1 Tax=Hypomesus transpacificus TaxID=137520 RepID=UPI001F076AEA|nr:uncharacterized protein LOC124479876 [Hypomesus transpacificus]
MPKTVQWHLPTPLTTLYSSTWLGMDLPSLLEEGAEIFEVLHLTPELCVLVGEKTREQRKSRVWFDQRAGRVTASMFHNAARTEKSSSLIKRVCYPRSSQFSTETTRWGLEKEDTAREAYLMAMQDLYVDLNVAASGLIINPDLPWIGVSPDGVVTCACHERGMVEIKCPFSAKDLEHSSLGHWNLAHLDTGYWLTGALDWLTGCWTLPPLGLRTMQKYAGNSISLQFQLAFFRFCELVSLKMREITCDDIGTMAIK